MRRTIKRSAAGALAALIGGGLLVATPAANAADPLETRVVFEVIDDNGDGRADAPAEPERNIYSTYTMYNDFSKMRVRVDALVDGEWKVVEGIPVVFAEINTGEQWQMCLRSTASEHDLRWESDHKVNGPDGKTRRDRLIGRADCDPSFGFPGQRCFDLVNPTRCYFNNGIDGQTTIQAVISAKTGLVNGVGERSLQPAYSDAIAVFRQPPISGTVL